MNKLAFFLPDVDHFEIGKGCSINRLSRNFYLRRSNRALAKRGDSGTTAIEYAVIAGLMALVLVPAMQAVNNGNNGLYGGVANKVAAAMPTSR